VRPGGEGRLAEFSALRTEIIDLNSAQRALMSLNLTASATLTGFTVGHADRVGLMVVVAFLSPTLGLLYLGYARSVFRLGDYIQARLEGDLDIGWEAWSRPRRRKNYWAIVEQGVPIGLIFLAPAVAGIIVSGQRVEQFGGGPVWALAIALSAAFLLAAVLFVATRARSRRAGF
jgi:hypothetical protein